MLCTGGDILIALASLTLALIFAGERGWETVGTLVIAFGVGYSANGIASMRGNPGAYSHLMPVLPGIGYHIALSPLLQWVVVPGVTLWATRRVSAQGA